MKIIYVILIVLLFFSGLSLMISGVNPFIGFIQFLSSVLMYGLGYENLERS